MNAHSTIQPAAPQSVYAKIAKVQGELAKVGIAKDRKNQTPGASYNFRGIDEVYNTLARLLADTGLCILPRMVGHSLTERGKTAKGNAIYSAIVEAEFDFVSADDGSVHTVRSYGEAMDSSDKATNKAMSAAYKYMALMTFAIPTEGDNDADATTHEVQTVAPPAKREPQHSGLKQQVRAFVHELNGCGDGDELSAFLATPDAIKLVNEVREKRPQWWTGWDEQPDGFTPLADLITRRQQECAQATANYLTA